MAAESIRMMVSMPRHYRLALARWAKASSVSSAQVVKTALDHVIPKTQGGRDTWENLVCACVKCNNRKGDRSPEQSGMALVRKPRLPNSAAFIRHFIGVPDKRWRPYLFMD